MEDTLLKSYHISKAPPSTVQQPKSHVHLGIRQEGMLPGIAGEYLMIISPCSLKDFFTFTNIITNTTISLFSFYNYSPGFLGVIIPNLPDNSAWL